jgi:deoxyribonuclease-4
LNKIGIHIRLTTTINDVIEKAIRLKIPVFQTFAVTDTGHVIKLEQETVDSYLKLRREHFKDLYLHSSYWVNLSRNNKRSYQTFIKELELAQKLEFTHYILHPGAAETKANRLEGIDTLANNLNTVLSEDLTTTVLLENTAHGGRSIGSNLEDFKILLDKLKHPNKVKFCLDTSHAYAYGYDISNLNELANFMDIIDRTITFDRIALIHLNDTTENLGSKIDKHRSPGHGNIGSIALKKFIQHPKLKKVPVIIELPKLDEADEIRIIKEVENW